MKAISKKRIISILMIVFLLFSSVSVSNVRFVQAASDESLIMVDDLLESENETQSTNEDATEEDVVTNEDVEEVVTEEDVATEETTTENTGDIQSVEVEEVEVKVASGGAIINGNLTTWDASAIVAASEKDNGLTLHGSGWTVNEAKDDLFFTDNYPVKGPNAKAGSDKAKTDGINADKTIPDSGCYISYEATEDGKLSFYEKTGSGKTFYIVGSDGTVEVLKNETKVSTYDIVTVDVKAGVTYYAYLGAGTAQVWQVIFEKAQKTEWSAQDLINNGGQDDNGLIIRGEGWSQNDASDALSFADGFPVAGPNAKAGSKKAQTDGSNAKGSIPNGGCYLEYTASKDGTFAVYTKINKDKTFWAVGNDGSSKDIPNNTGASAYEIVEIPVTAGVTYYFYQAESTAQFWKAIFKDVQPVTPWDEVATPVINDVTVNDEGNFVVDFTAVIDSAKGAENLKITMLCNGLEVTTVDLTFQNDEVVMTPLSNGDYTFYATAQRAGYPDKKSESFNYPGYVLAVRKPVIELVQGNEDGSIYVDWMNIPDANKYKVEYKKTTDADYTVAVEETTDGHATIAGNHESGSYDIKVSAIREADNFVAVYENTYEVSKEYQWHFATIGSAQETNAEIKDGDTVLETVELSSKDTAAEKKNVVDATDVTNTDMTIVMNGSTSGKISDGEEGFSYYYTMIDPNTTNFELTATYKITDTSLTPDNQTGFGLIATDMLGINYYGSPDYGHKYFNSISNQLYSAKGKMLGLRVITGYNSFDTSSNEDVTRTTHEVRFKETTGNFDLGTTYTFTLRKTDDGFYALLNGEEIKYDDLSVLSVQEDGSICVGLMVSRKVTCEISDVKFTTSESQGVGSGADKDETIKPSLRVYSTGTTGAKEYEYIVETSAAGDLIILGADGSEAYNKYVEENEVVKIMIPVSVGKNEIKTTLTPDKSKTYTNYDVISSKTTVEVKRYFEEGEVIYVSPNGSSENLGTKESPLDINTAVKYAQPGQYIYLLNGTYTGNGVTIARSVSGTKENPITMVAETPGKVIFEGQGIRLVGSYWHIYGIYVHYPSAVGIQISGNYNTIEMCTVEGSQNTGVQISRDGGAERENGLKYLLWPSYNLVKNVESFDNCDPGRNDADGFAAKLTSGEGNVFYGCIGHNNIDDGWDLFAKAISGNIGKVTIINCVAYDNGWLTTEDTSAPGYSYGEGNGFKLGGNDLKGGHTLINSISFNNAAKGITSNSCPDNVIINSTSFNNNIAEGIGYNVGLNKKPSNLMEWKVDGLISYSTTTSTADLIPFSLSSPTNYIYNGTASYNSLGEMAVEDWFVSTDVTVKPTRNEDGTINMHGLLELNESAPQTSGGRLDVTSDDAKSVYPEVNFVQNGEPTEPSTTPEPTSTPRPTSTPSTGSDSDNESTVSPTPQPEKVEIVSVDKNETVQSILKKDKNNSTAIIAVVTGGEKGKISVSVDVSSNKELKSGERVYVFRVDSKTGKLLSIPGGYGYKVSANGKVDLTLATEGEYVILENAPSNSVIRSIPAQVWSSMDYSVLYLDGEIGATRELKLHLPETVEIVNSLNAKPSSKAMTVAKVDYFSSNTAVATVSKDGVITAKSNGKAVIVTKVTFASGKVKTMKRTIVVKEPSVRFNIAKTTLKTNETIDYSVKGLGYPTDKVEVSVQNNGVLELVDGKIKAVKAGSAVVTAKYGDVTVKTEITVK
ncbi:right-handed parallel beta-helix repeat-containing protein [Clostridium sp. Marseille-P299]|uniref:right-handed parallel beta-helix repeat-containing protein n=1 Tax=Clostridium sp. Marseille-P299 TaxID=1805477 RepID=UPI00082976B4|nr:right-handed parallel beta-helix repeat-containing protein [Clostridium sp. Marseille-P299]